MNKPNAPVTARENDAAGTLVTLLTWGVIALIVGGIILGVALGMESDVAACDDVYDDCEDGGGGGRLAVLLVGAAIAGVGQMLTLVGVIGYGVFLGIARAGGRPVTAEPAGQGMASWRQEVPADPAPGTGLASFRKPTADGTDPARTDDRQE